MSNDPITATTPMSGMIASPARMLIGFAEMLLSDVDPAKYADRFGTSINHPAFILGHTAYYAGYAMKMLGGQVEFRPDEEQLYSIDAECQDDASLYPPMDEALKHFRERYDAVATFVAACDDAALQRPNEDGPFKSTYQTVGEVAGFMIVGHTAFHLGQLSAWRRAAGMEAATSG